MHRRILALLCALALFAPVVAHADALDDLRIQIEALTAQVRQLQEQIRLLLERTSAQPVQTQQSTYVSGPLQALYEAPGTGNYDSFFGTNATTTPPGGTSAPTSCTTPWGALVVADRSLISSEPYFNNGFSTDGFLVPQMKCDRGKWLTCDYQGNSCYDNGGRVDRPLCLDNQQRSVEGIGMLVCRAGVWRR